MMNIAYFSMIAIFAAGGCEEEVLLIPERMAGDVYSSSYPLSKLLDGSYSSYWMGNSYKESVFYYYSSRVTVKKVFVQRNYNYASQVSVIDDQGRDQRKYFGTSTEYYDTVTFPMNIQTVSIRFTFYFSPYPRIARAEVWGCYNTSTPTTVPTSGPTDLPTIFPTLSPTLPPTTTHPTEAPSLFPTTAPTGSPSAENPSTYPSTAPTLSPATYPSTAPTWSPSTYPSTAPTWSPTQSPSRTEPPSPIPSISPSSSPTLVYIDRGFHVTVGQVELLIIVVIFLCGVIFFVFRRYKNVLQVIDHSQKVEEGEMQIVKSHDIQEAVTRMMAKNGFNPRGDMNNTICKEGENYDTQTCKRVNYSAGEEKNERIESQVVSDQTVDFRFALDKVNSEL